MIKGNGYDIHGLIKGGEPEKNFFFVPGFKKHTFKIDVFLSHTLAGLGIVQKGDNSKILETQLLTGFIILTPRLLIFLSSWILGNSVTPLPKSFCGLIASSHSFICSFNNY